ncbi:hypothetical protein P9112_006646 [Eukaryota sp. TZLM1-RC]
MSVDSNYLTALNKNLVLLGFHPEFGLSIDAQSLGTTVKSQVDDEQSHASSIFKVIHRISSPLVLGRYHASITKLLSKNPVWKRLLKSIIRISVSFTTEEPSLQIHSSANGVELTDMIKLDADLIPHPVSIMTSLRSSLPAASTDYFKSSFNDKFKGLALYTNLSHCTDLECPAASARVAAAIGDACDALESSLFAALRSSKVQLTDAILYCESAETALSSIIISPLPDGDTIDDVSNDVTDTWKIFISEDTSPPKNMLLSRCSTLRTLHVQPSLSEDITLDSSSLLFSPATFTLRFLLSKHFGIEEVVCESDWETVSKSAVSSVDELKNGIDDVAVALLVNKSQPVKPIQSFMASAALSGLPLTLSLLPAPILTEILRNLSVIRIDFIEDTKKSPVNIYLEKTRFNALKHKQLKPIKSLVISVTLPSAEVESLYPGGCLTRGFVEKLANRLSCESSVSLYPMGKFACKFLTKFRSEIRRIVGLGCQVSANGIEDFNKELDVLSGLFGLYTHYPLELYDLLSLFAPGFSVDATKNVELDEEDFGNLALVIIDGLRSFMDEQQSLSIKKIVLGQSRTPNLYFDHVTSSLYYYYSLIPFDHPKELDIKNVLLHAALLPTLPAIDVSSKVNSLKEIRNSRYIGLEHIKMLFKFELFNNEELDVVNIAKSILPPCANPTRHYLFDALFQKKPKLVLMTDSNQSPAGFYIFTLDSNATRVETFADKSKYKFFSFTDIQQVLIGTFVKQSLPVIAIVFGKDKEEEVLAFAVPKESTNSPVLQRQTSGLLNEFGLLNCIFSRYLGHEISIVFGSVVNYKKSDLKALN